MHRISHVVVTGFLGAGKSTLLRRLMRGWHDRRIAFIVNDLAEMDVDGRVLEAEQGENTTVTRLSSGCICCTLRGEFETTVQQLIETHQPDALVVESSGVTNPQAVLHGLNHPRLRLDSVITVVDAERFLDYMHYSAAVETQVYMADFVLLNKRELVTPAQLAQVEAQVRRFNQKCAILSTSYCDTPLDVLFGAQAAHADRELRHREDEDHLHEDGIEHVVVNVPRPLSHDRLTQALKSDVMNGVYRAKGFVQIIGEDGFSLFNYVPRRYGLERGVKTDLEDGEGFVVFIGKRIADKAGQFARFAR
jgi:cobalamin biosynthesis protein CobW